MKDCVCDRRRRDSMAADWQPPRVGTIRELDAREDDAKLLQRLTISCPEVLDGASFECILTDVIGKGCFGTVYAAQCPAVWNGHIAIKVMKGLRTRLQTEIEVMARVSRTAKAQWRQHVAAFHWAALTPDGTTAAVGMELCRPVTLHEVLALTAMPSPAATLRLVWEVMCAVAAVHEVGCIHRDLKLVNFVFGYDGNVKLVDFGLAERVLQPPPGDIVGGTISFMAPEMARNALREDAAARESVGVAADVWSLGVCIILIVTRRSPYPSSGSANMPGGTATGGSDAPTPLLKAVANGEWRWPPEYAVGPAFKNIELMVNGMLQKSPSARPRVATVLHQFQSALAKRAPALPPQVVSIVTAHMPRGSTEWDVQPQPMIREATSASPRRARAASSRAAVPASPAAQAPERVRELQSTELRGAALPSASQQRASLPPQPAAAPTVPPAAAAAPLDPKQAAAARRGMEAGERKVRTATAALLNLQLKQLHAYVRQLEEAQDTERYNIEWLADMGAKYARHPHQFRPMQTWPSTHPNGFTCDECCYDFPPEAPQRAGKRNKPGASGATPDPLFFHCRCGMDLCVGCAGAFHARRTCDRCHRLFANLTKLADHRCVAEHVSAPGQAAAPSKSAARAASSAPRGKSRSAAANPQSRQASRAAASASPVQQRPPREASPLRPVTVTDAIARTQWDMFKNAEWRDGVPTGTAPTQTLPTDDEYAWLTDSGWVKHSRHICGHATLPDCFAYHVQPGRTGAIFGSHEFPAHSAVLSVVDRTLFVVDQIEDDGDDAVRVLGVDEGGLPEKWYYKVLHTIATEDANALRRRRAPGRMTVLGAPAPPPGAPPVAFVDPAEPCVYVRLVREDPASGMSLLLLSNGRAQVFSVEGDYELRWTDVRRIFLVRATGECEAINQQTFVLAEALHRLLYADMVNAIDDDLSNAAASS